MKFSYNSNLSFYERITQVAEEIRKEYPLISFKDAAYAAADAIAVDDKVTNDEKFNRYYYIMKIIGRDHDEFSHVFNDAYKVYEDGLKDQLYIQAMENIIEYALGNRDEFPYIYEG